MQSGQDVSALEASMMRAPFRRMMKMMGGQQNAGRQYLFHDDFTTDASSPLTTPRTCEPGPGSLVIGAELADIVSIASGALSVSGQPAGLSTNRIYGSAPFLRKAGRTFHMKLTGRATAGTSRFGWGDYVSNYIHVGFDSASNNIYPHIVLNGATGQTTPMITVPVAAANTIVDFYFVMTDTGGHIIADVGATKKLMWTHRVGGLNATAGAMLYRWSSLTLTMDDLEVYDLAAPYASDYGIATARVATAGANETITGTADALIEFTWTPTENGVETLYFRRTDDDNTFKLVCTQADGTIKLYRRESASDTELNAGKTQTWTIGTAYRIVIQTDGSSIRIWVETPGDSCTGKHAITDTYNQTATGIKTTLGGSNLVAWPLSLPPF